MVNYKLVYFNAMGRAEVGYEYYSGLSQTQEFKKQYLTLCIELNLVLLMNVFFINKRSVDGFSQQPIKSMKTSDLKGK